MSEAVEPESVSRKIQGETVLLLGWGSAMLMQFAHPLVARGVADHSGFRRDTGAPWVRLQRTLHAMLALTFGTEEQVAAAAGAINAVHDRVHGTLPQSDGRYPAGTTYSARDPTLLAWVHATCLDAFMRTYELYVGALSPEEKDRYCAESSRVAPRLGIPSGHLPMTAEELAASMGRMLTSGQIEVTDTARRLARDLFTPALPVVARPAMWVVRLLAVGLLSARIRQAYGFPWSPRHRVTFRVCVWLVRRTLPLWPPVLRYWPAARLARRLGARGKCSADAP